jgi:phospholipid/cholesterol/gamma-HCH transport system substrate-binding protein
MHSRVIEIWVGLFVAIGFLALFFLAMKVSNLGELSSTREGYKLIARFENSGNLKVRAPVSMAGVTIGRVKSIRFDKASYESVVEMQIDPQYDTLPEDTSASILTAGLLGEQFIGLTAGALETFLKDGDQLELTQSALVLEQLISRFLFNKAEGEGNKTDKSSEAAK